MQSSARPRTPVTRVPGRQGLSHEPSRRVFPARLAAIQLCALDPIKMQTRGTSGQRVGWRSPRSRRRTRRSPPTRPDSIVAPGARGEAMGFAIIFLQHTVEKPQDALGRSRTASTSRLAFHGLHRIRASVGLWGDHSGHQRRGGNTLRPHAV